MGRNTFQVSLILIVLRSAAFIRTAHFIVLELLVPDYTLGMSQFPIIASSRNIHSLIFVFSFWRSRVRFSDSIGKGDPKKTPHFYDESLFIEAYTHFDDVYTGWPS